MVVKLTYDQEQFAQGLPNISTVIRGKKVYDAVLEDSFSLEDLVEEIFGEIKDEFDTEDAFELQLGDNRYRFAARLEIDYLNEKYGFDFKEGDFTTLGGYIIFHAERIPEVGETLRFENLEFHITKIDGARIEEVELKRF